MKIMQCWDDSSSNDIRLTELFKNYGAKATFNFIISEEDGSYGHDCKYNDFAVRHLNLSEMKDIYAGFKVAGHGSRHYQHISTNEFWDEVTKIKQCISEVFQQQECGYAYPGGGFNAEIKRIVKDTGFRYARTTRNVEAVLPLDDPFELPTHCHFASNDFAEKYRRVKETNGIFYFWGHSYEFMTDEKLWNEFERTLEHIAADDNVEWIDIIDLFS